MNYLPSLFSHRFSTGCHLAIGLGCFFLASAARAGVPLPVIPNRNFNVTNYGAVGDGVATNTVAIQNAINAAGAAGGGIVEVPAGVFLSGPLTLQSSINLHLDAGAILRMLPFGKYPVTWHTNGADVYFVASNFISGAWLHDIEISGSGAIDGQGEPWWPWAYTNNAARPIMIRLRDCNRELIQNLTLSNSPKFHISITGTHPANTTIQGVTIRAPSSHANPPSHNTDACDVDGTNIVVRNCDISVGDDDFTCGGDTSDVLVTNNTYGNGHGVSIGSGTRGGVSNITVVNCTFNGTDKGIRIKSDNDRGGLVRNIHYYNLSMTNVGIPILIYAYYREIGTPRSITPSHAAGESVAAVTSTTPIYRNITFSNITATSVSGYPIGVIWARTEMPATNIIFDKVNVTGDRNFCLYNVHGARFIDCNLKTSSGWNTFALFNARAIITNSAPASRLATLDGLTANGCGNSLAFYNTHGALSSTNAFGTGPHTLAASTLSVSGNLTLFPATVLDFVLGTNAATLGVNGNLTLGGTNNVVAGGGFGLGTYTLMTYGGSLNGTLPVLGTVPSGYSYRFDTNTPGQVNLVVAPIPTEPPSTPTNLAAKAGDNQVTLAWSPVLTATGYIVKRSTVNGGPYSPTATPPGAGYTDTQVTNGTTYCYVVAAVNALGHSSDSAPVSATPRKPTFMVITTNVFTDSFSASTLNSTSPTAPTSSATSYELISSKPWNPAPSIGLEHLQFGIKASSSGCIEAQGRFANPVTLAAPGDSVSLILTFNNSAGLLTGSSALGFGLYQSGGVSPVRGGLNGTGTTSYSDHTSGNAQMWVGYVGQLAFTGDDCRIMTRPAQTVGPLYNNDQDLVTSGSGSSSYRYPAATTVGTASSVPSVTLTAGNTYTEVLTITLAATHTLTITNSLYAGMSTNGALLSQFGGLASGGTCLTNTFDALAVGWRETGLQPTAIDINHIAVQSTTITAVTSPVSLSSTNLISQVAGNQLELSWPADHLGWTLQTNAVGLRATNAWFPYPGSTLLTNLAIPLDATTNVFFRLIYNP